MSIRVGDKLYPLISEETLRIIFGIVPDSYKCERVRRKRGRVYVNAYVKGQYQNGRWCPLNEWRSERDKLQKLKLEVYNGI